MQVRAKPTNYVWDDGNRLQVVVMNTYPGQLQPTNCCELLPSQKRQHGSQGTRNCSGTKQTNIVRSFNELLPFCNTIRMRLRT